MPDVVLSGSLVDVDELADVIRGTDGALDSRLPTVHELGMFDDMLRQLAETLEPAGPRLSRMEDHDDLAALPDAAEVLRLVTHADWIAREADRVAVAARAFGRALEDAHAD